MSKILNVGVVGCGEVAQIIHLPALRELTELFRVTALCDVSPEVLEAVGAREPQAGRFADAQALIDKGKVDAILVSNPHVYHADVALAAIGAGKHVLVEKPMCITLAEADSLLHAEEKAGVTVQVGYMRRYAPAFLEAVEHVSRVRTDVRFARVHDVIGANALIIESTSKVYRPKTIDSALLCKGKELFAARTRDAIGEGDTSPRRRLRPPSWTGQPRHFSDARADRYAADRVLYAAQRAGGRMVTAAFDFGAFVCQFETGVNKIPHFDAYLEVSTSSEIIRVDYDTPYIRHLPARLTILSAAEPAGISNTVRFPTRNDAFVAEWRAFHANVTTGTPPKTSIDDFRNDLVLFKDMVALME